MYHYTDKALTANYNTADLKALDTYLWDDYFNRSDVPHPYHSDITDVATSLMYHHWLFLGGQGYYALYWDMLTQIADFRNVNSENLLAALNITKLEALRRDLELHGETDNTNTFTFSLN